MQGFKNSKLKKKKGGVKFPFHGDYCHLEEILDIAAPFNLVSALIHSFCPQMCAFLIQFVI